jgi:hypothetical protein
LSHYYLFKADCSRSATGSLNIDTDDPFIPNDPGIMTWTYDADVTRTEHFLASIRIHLDAETSGYDCPDEVVQLAAIAAHCGPNMLRPPPARLDSQTFHVEVPQAHGLDLDLREILYLIGIVEASSH